MNALYKKELIDNDTVWHGVSEVNFATAEWIYWYNKVRLHSWCDYRPPLEFETVFWDGEPAQPPAAA